MVSLLNRLNRDSKVDEFVYRLDKRHKTRYNTVYWRLAYFNIFRNLPLLKSITLDVPVSIEFNPKNLHYNQHLLHSYKQCLIYALLLFPIGTFDPLLLLWYIWKGARWILDPFTIKYSLNLLTLDVTLVVTKMKELWSEGFSVDDFFVIQIQMLNTGERNLYKVLVVYLQSSVYLTKIAVWKVVSVEKNTFEYVPSWIAWSILKYVCKKVL